MNTKTNEKAKADALQAQIDANAKADAQFVADREAARTAIMATAEEMGGKYAAGQMSLTHLAYLLSDAARLGYAKEADVNDLYRAYAKGNNDAVDAGKVMIGNQEYVLSGAGTKLDGSDKSPINNLKSFARLAAAMQGLKLYEDIIRIRPGIDKDLVAGSEYVLMVRVNRALSKIADDKALTEDELRAGALPYPTDDELRAMCSKEAKEAATFAKKLSDACDALKTLCKKGEANDLGMRDVFETLLKVQSDYLEREKARKVKADKLMAAPLVPTLPANAVTSLEAAE